MLTIVDKGEAPPPAPAAESPDNVVKAHFRRPSVADQLRLIADRLDKEGAWPEPDYMCIVFAYDDPGVNMTCLNGGLKDAHPYMLAGMLQNAMLSGLDEAAALAFMDEEGLGED